MFSLYHLDFIGVHRHRITNPLGVHTQGFVGVSYPGTALGQRVSHIFGIRTCDPIILILNNIQYSNCYRNC